MMEKALLTSGSTGEEREGTGSEEREGGEEGFICPELMHRGHQWQLPIASPYRRPPEELESIHALRTPDLDKFLPPKVGASTGCKLVLLLCGRRQTGHWFPLPKISLVPVLGV